ncbi:V-type ATP synthase subunit I [Thalassoroseus pseudoceratinae]|uniref:V-type ATP synthase subunit I n=1 Tax=Thalassoroseus pseudoceratinae TaxID=2713176 RepID=UPI00141E5E1D|nr:V-type ATPase 116kDa subunit family protein [Thalassoroseus pseudoceratinae]
MAIVELKRATLFGTNSQQTVIIDGLQKLGCMHLINLRETPVQAPQLVSKEARETLKYLTSSPTQRRQEKSRYRFDREKLIRDVLEIKQQKERRISERDDLKKAITDLEPWGEFQLPDADETGGLRFWFFQVPRHRLTEIPDEINWYVANEGPRFAYVVVLAHESPELPFPPLELDRRPLSELRQELQRIEHELEELDWKRVTLTRWRTLLKKDLDAADDQAAQHAAAQCTLRDPDVFALQGWVPESACEDVKRFADEHDVALTLEAVTPEDQPPTLLKNPDRVAGAEGCVTFYITPNYHAWDPTFIVFFSFSLFFAMIVADAGYGLLMAGILFLSWRKLSQSASAIQFRNLLVGIVFATVVYGVLVGSYFGVEPREGYFADRLRVRIGGEPMMNNQTAMMGIAVAIGVIHLSLANGISAWNSRRSFRCLGHLGWAFLIQGGFLMGAGRLAEIPQLFEIGKMLAIGGGVGILLFSSDRTLLSWNPIWHLRRLFDGIMQVANLSKAFGDCLSYLRLFALGLASAQLAVTFNDLAQQASQTRGFGILLALLILVVGHGINLLLGLMGGVVHGLRLNCIEFFNWSLTSEGYTFQPFNKKAET